MPMETDAQFACSTHVRTVLTWISKAFGANMEPRVYYGRTTIGWALATLASAILCSSSLAAASTPTAGSRAAPLLAMPGTVTGPPILHSTLLSDGTRYVVYRLKTGGTVVLDTRTGHSTELASSICPELAPPIPSRPAYRPLTLTKKRLLADCLLGREQTSKGEFISRDELLITSTTSLATTRPRFQPTPFPSPFVFGEDSAVGTQWTRYLGCEDGSTGSFCGEEQIFNYISNYVYPHRIRPSSNYYFDLDAPGQSPLRRLCRPVTLPHPQLEELGVTKSERLLGVEGSWVLIGRLQPDEESDALFAWNCGSRRPIRLGLMVNNTAQLGANLVSWFDPKWILHVENINSRQQRQWHVPLAAREYDVCVHTENAVFVAEPGNRYGRPIMMASLHELQPTPYVGPAPAVVVTPAP